MNNQAIRNTIDIADYFDQLDEAAQAVVKEFARQFVDADYNVEDIECRRRDGFIPHSWNRGGIEAHRHEDLGYFWGGGYSVGVKAAQKVIDKWTDIALKDAKESFIEKYAEVLSDLEVPNDKVDFHGLRELGHIQLSEEFGEYENEHLYGEYSSTLHTVRILYNGDNKWTVAVLHRISDAPYHRTCDGFKEWKFTASTVKQLTSKLNGLKAKIEKAFV